MTVRKVKYVLTFQTDVLENLQHNTLFKQGYNSQQKATLMAVCHIQLVCFTDRQLRALELCKVTGHITAYCYETLIQRLFCAVDCPLNSLDFGKRCSFSAVKISRNKQFLFARFTHNASVHQPATILPEIDFTFNATASRLDAQLIQTLPVLHAYQQRML